jgi:hypothetical protein
MDPESGLEVVDVDGGLDLKISAYVAIHFGKYVGAISVETHKNQIYSIQLRPRSQLSQKNNIDIIKISKRIYKSKSLIDS